MGRMEAVKIKFASTREALRLSTRMLGGWVVGYPVGFFGLCLLAAGVLILTDVRWDEWPPRFVSWYVFWTKDAAAARNLALVVFGPLAAAAGLILATVRTAAAHRQARVAEARLDTERFSKAIEQLGHGEEAVRLGAIYALEQVAKDSPKEYHWPIMETLTAFARQRVPEPVGAETASEVEPTQGDDGPKGCETASADGEGKEAENIEAQKAEFMPIGADVSAAMAVLARRNAVHDPEGRFLDLSRAYLTGLSLVNVEARNLANARLMSAHLEGANLRSVHLERARLNSARLEGANLRSAHLKRAQLRSAHLEGPHLWSADLSLANLRSAHLEQAHLQGAHLEGARLWSAHLEGTDLRRAHLEGARLRGAHLEGTDLRRAHLDGTRLEGAHLDGADLRGADLKSSKVTAVQLAKAKYPLRANLSDDMRAELEELLAAKDEVAD